jgi:hypothetical protein
MTRITTLALAAMVTAGATLGLGAAPASADAIFTFTQTGATPANGVAFSGSLAVTDEAYADGIDIAFSNRGSLPPSQTGLDQLTALSFDFAVPGGLSRSFTEQDFFIPRPPGDQSRRYEFSFRSTAEGILEGLVRFNDTIDQFNLDLDASGGDGLFISDRGGLNCGRAPGCSFTFTVSQPRELTAVPEAASVTLFCTGLVALAGVARRRKQRRA